MKTENVSIVQVKGIEVRCGNCGMGLSFSHPISQNVKTECVTCGHDIATGILAAKRFFEFEQSALSFVGQDNLLNLRIGEIEEEHEQEAQQETE
jgi:hypothetical protein